MTTTIEQLSNDEITQWSAAQGEPEWLTRQRQASWEAYHKLPVPLKTEEAWKYTKLEKLAGWDQTGWSATSADSGTLSCTAPTAKVICTDIATALREHSAIIRPYLELAETDQTTPRRSFSGLAMRPYGGTKYICQQEALWDQGTFLYVPKGVTVAAPVHATVASRTDGVTLFPRTIIVLEAGASLIYVDEFTGNTTSETITSCHARSEMYLGEGSRLNYVAIQRWPQQFRHFHQQQAILQRDAQVTTMTINLGAQVMKTVTEAVLTEPGTEARMYGLGFGDTTQHMDHHTLQTHLAPNTFSDLLYKIALKDTSRSIFTGLIKMGHEAQQSQAYQSNRNLLLTHGTHANAIPQLEIDANDVKCSHGATIGKVDPEQLYYLTTRGLPKAEAEKTLVHGFFEEVLDRLPDPQVEGIVREAIARKLGDR